MLKSGVHATIAGVLLAFAIPFGKGDSQSISYKLQHGLHKPIAFIVLPLFALANTGIVLSGDWTSGFLNSNTIGIMAGLFIGKPAGIFLFSYLSVKTGIVKIIDKPDWKNIFGAGILGGIGFTMSIFITLLAFERNENIINSKIAILISSLIAGITGFLVLKFNNRKDKNDYSKTVSE